jgi:hypothetical protein
MKKLMLILSLGLAFGLVACDKDKGSQGPQQYGQWGYNQGYNNQYFGFNQPLMGFNNTICSQYDGAGGPGTYSVPIYFDVVGQTLCVEFQTFSFQFGGGFGFQQPMPIYHGGQYFHGGAAGCIQGLRNPTGCNCNTQVGWSYGQRQAGICYY